MAQSIEDATGLPVGPVTLAHAAPRPHAILLEGRYVRLEPLDAPRHGGDLHSLSQGEKNASLWTYLFDAPAADAEAFNGIIAARAASADPLFCAIIERASGKAVGMASLMRIDERHRVIEVGNILFTPALQRKPGATEAMYLLMKHVFDDLGYRRYEWKCNNLNAPSKQAARRLGFQFEGVFRQHMIVKGRNRDTAWFSMLDSEWPARRAAFESWLSPANFEADGKQKKALAAFVQKGETAEFAGLRLRRGTAADKTEIEAMQAAAYQRNAQQIGRTPVPMQWDYGQKLAEDEVWLAAGADGLAGVLMLAPRPEDLYLGSIAVAPHAQGDGLGGRLLAFAESRARHHGKSLVRLMTNAKLHHNIAWYQRNGYVIEREETLPDRIAVHMAKILGEG